MRRSRVCIVWGLCLVTLVAAGIAGAGSPSTSERAPSLSSAAPLTEPPPAGPSAADQPTADDATPTAGLRAYGQLPLSFEANHGQSAAPVQFLSRGHGYTLFLTPTEAVLVLRPPRPVRASPTSNAPGPEAMPQETVVRMRLVGANPAPQVVGQDTLPGKAHYLTGPASTWRTQIPTYARVQYHEVYAGIDLVYYGNQRQLEYDFVLAPGADPRTITLAFQGVDTLEVDAHGTLLLHTPRGLIHQRKPHIYQEVDGVRQEIPGGYVLTQTGQVGVHVAAYDATRPLVIDPVLAYSTYLGGSGSGSEGSAAIAVDAAGHAYVTGVTSSATFPTTSGALQPTPVGSQDAFVAKLNPTGTALVYSTYLGGSGVDASNAIAVDAAGHAYVTGVTRSNDFPTAPTPGAFQPTRAGSDDAFVTKLNPDGTALVYSTYLGGTNEESGAALTVDAAGNAYVTGGTTSNDFPTTSGAFQPTPVAQEDAFVTKLNATGSGLFYSTYLGGGRAESGAAIAVDAVGNAYVTGVTTSDNFPTTPGAFQPTPLGVPDAFLATPPDVSAATSPAQDAFVVKLNAAGNALEYSTYLSGTNADGGTGIAVDPAGNAYVTGFTASVTFPTTPGVFQPTLLGTEDAFVTTLNAAGNGLLYSTYLGGTNTDSGAAIAVDPTGNASVTGFTTSANFPTTPDAFQRLRGGAEDAFVTTLNATGNALLYATYLGGVDTGAGREGGTGIAVDPACHVYVTGVTRSSDFPTTPGVVQPAFGGGGDDGFVTKIAAEACPPTRIALLKSAVTPPPYTIGGPVTFQYTLTNQSTVTLTNPRVEDNKVTGITCASFTGTPATAVCTGTHVIQADDVNASRVFTNVATGLAQLPNGAELSARDTLLLPVVPPGQLGISKSAAPNPVVAGQEITFTVTAINATPAAATVFVTDEIPVTTTFVRAEVPATPPGWTVQPPTGSNPAVIQFTHPALPAQSSSTLLVVVRVNAGVPPGTVISNRACIDSSTDRCQGASASAQVQVRAPQADLAVTKTNFVDSVARGSVTTYAVVVRNLGPDPVQGAQVSDPLPPGFRALTWACLDPSAGSACPVPPTGAGLLDTQVNLAVDGRVLFVVRAEVSPTAVGSVTDTVTVTAPPGVAESPPANNTARDTDTVLPGADIAVRKTVDNATPLVGQTVTFTVTATNLGPDAATGVKLSDGVPAGLTLLSATPSQGTYTASTGDWDLGALAVNAQATLTLVAQVEQAGLIGNVATKIAADQVDPNTSNNSSGVDLTPQPVADIRVHKTADLLVLPVGSDVTFTVTVTNAGPSAASGVEFTDVLPPGLAFVSATPAQGTYTPTTGVWAMGALAVNAQTTLTLRATVQEAGELTNRAAKTAQVELDPNPANDVSGVTINGQAADVQVVKTVDQDMPLVGETVTFTVTVTNNGPNAATGVEVLDLLAPGLVFVSATPSQGTYTATTGLWEVGALAAAGPEATATLQITATVTQAGPLTNLAVKSAQDQPDPNPANDQDSMAPPGQPVADLVVTKSNDTGSVVPGTEVIYTVVVTNRGPSAVTGAIVRDPNPLLLRDPSRGRRAFESLTWTCVASAGSACPGSGTGDVLATVDLLVGGTATFTMRGRVAAAAVETVVNTAAVIPPAAVLDPLLGNNFAPDTDRLTPVADLSLTKTDAVQSVVPGTTARYTLVVHNAGPSAVSSARVQDPESAGLAGVRWTCVASAGSSCLAAGTGPIDTTVNLAPGGTVTFTLIGTVTAEATGTLANTATVTPPPGVIDPELGNNTATDTNAVLPSAVLGPPAGRKTVQVGAVSDLEWRVVWLNNGNTVPLRTRILDPLPAATTYVDGSLTCVPRGLSTVARCDFDAAINQLVYEGIIGPDPGATTEEQAANEVVITFRTAVLPGVTQVANQALAHWDASGNGAVDDDIRAGQVPVRTGTEFGRSDPTVATFPGLACLFQQRLLALTGPAGGGPGDTAPTDGQDAAVDAGVDRQSAPGTGGVFTLSTPLDRDTVAGTAVTLAALQVPVSGTVVSQPAEILIANGTAADTLDLVENVGSKTERVPAGEAHDVITADGVVVELPATALPAADTLRLERVAPATAPVPLPGVAVGPLVAVRLASGRTAFSGPIMLSLPYPDADQDGFVDAISPALPELTLTAWGFDAARGGWVRLPEARVFTAFNTLRVPATQTGLYGVFQAADGSTGLAGTSEPASPSPRSTAAQGLGWQDIGVVTTFPFLVPVNTTTLPNGTYALRAICATTPAALRTVASSAPATSPGLQASSGGGGGGGCTLQPGGAGARATALAALGNIGVPLVALLLLGLWAWWRPRGTRGREPAA